MFVPSGGSVKVDGEDVSVQELSDLYTGIKDLEKEIKSDYSKGDLSQHKYSDTVERLEAIKATAKQALKENDRNVKEGNIITMTRTRTITST